MYTTKVWSIEINNLLRAYIEVWTELPYYLCCIIQQVHNGRTFLLATAEGSDTTPFCLLQVDFMYIRPLCEAEISTVAQSPNMLPICVLVACKFVQIKLTYVKGIANWISQGRLSCRKHIKATFSASSQRLFGVTVLPAVQNWHWWRWCSKWTAMRTARACETKRHTKNMVFKWKVYAYVVGFCNYCIVSCLPHGGQWASLCNSEYTGVVLS